MTAEITTMLIFMPVSVFAHDDFREGPPLRGLCLCSSALWTHISIDPRITDPKSRKHLSYGTYMGGSWPISGHTRMPFPTFLFTFSLRFTLHFPRFPLCFKLALSAFSDFLLVHFFRAFFQFRSIYSQFTEERKRI